MDWSLDKPLDLFATHLSVDGIGLSGVSGERFGRQIWREMGSAVKKWMQHKYIKLFLVIMHLQDWQQTRLFLS